MFDNATLEDPAMRIDPRHDGRHALPDLPTARESSPYLTILPQQQIAIITYTWVSRESLAGAALAIFGPGVGAEPIQQRIADQPVPKEMNWDDWRIEGFRMQQDLRFDKAQIQWESPAASVDFSFEAFHPPYSYGADPRGCPAYLADDRIEQAGRVKGQLRIGEQTIEFDATGHRDHSWGTRDWIPFQQHEWFLGQVGTDIAVHYLRYQAMGRQHVRGYVFKEGLMSRVVDVLVDVSYDDQFWQKKYNVVLHDAAGRKTTVEADVFGVYCLVPDPAICLNESGALARIDGKAGVGWMECGWPSAYLAHIRSMDPKDR